ncbi:MAG: MoaD/ThiS family protein [Chloroflexi bacterium]|mgnify:CR=1 FL=1|nr:MoaD/ThiS family protein [Chloroflexota bacterium]
MFVRVKLYGTLRRLSQSGTPGLWQGEISPGTRILDLITLIGSSAREVSAASVDGAVLPLETVIPDGTQEIILVTPMGGG